MLEVAPRGAREREPDTLVFTGRNEHEAVTEGIATAHIEPCVASGKGRARHARLETLALHQAALWSVSTCKRSRSILSALTQRVPVDT
jgi:hypothetical protein